MLIIVQQEINRKDVWEQGRGLVDGCRVTCWVNLFVRGKGGTCLKGWGAACLIEVGRSCL